LDTAADNNTPVAVHCANVTRTFDKLIAVNDLSLTIPRGQFTAILGPNGAGKTTLIEMLEGIQFADSGTIELLGMNWRDDSQKLRSTIGLSLQETHFMDRLTVRETINLFAGFYGLGPDAGLARIGEVGLNAKLDDRVGPLSGGQRQKLALAIALLPDPKILFLDEPTTGLDPGARRDLWKIVENLRSQDATLVLTTHYLEEAEQLCDWIVIMDQGSILAQGTVQDLVEKYTPGDTIMFRIENPELHDWDSLAGVQRANCSGQTVTLGVQSMSKTMPHLFDVLGKHNVQPITFEARRASLEDVFLLLAGRSLNDD